MKGYLYTACWSVFVWFFATMFFVMFGDSVLFRPGTAEFAVSLSLLIAGTGVLLAGATYLYVLFDKAENAPLKFGFIGTIVGLILDTFSLSNHQLIFPKLDEPQVIAFAAWMSFAYALYLLIPAIINELMKKKLKTE
ncbi:MULTISPECIES: DUF5367 family protein [Aeribacillus]|jgi:hypothetical protein|uniref:DUF5367 domain-containing protein n=2 Tax=Aeribacillus TaxID=1055323 RepID=A0A161Y2T9_9BACI|nr:MULTISPECIES: DUF5367 family protein [Aeribacillus]REJ21946.1 MAG: hypothetical protein C6W54_15585 [Bacillaceae bacterium]ASS89211.1 hypothetical protein AP3564_02040 [Aeribacillus pallidus]KZM56116.1 hypothetical protein A3Q35_09650 [Aeribacillus pallidus]KZN95942.1 hypothetical protein AZI98_11360 [Aeribacillus pallidus]MDR9794625.1 DUF5367 family protein [Aeribacillus pallidus]